MLSSIDFGIDIDEQINNLKKQSCVKKVVGEDKLTQISRLIAEIILKEVDYKAERCGVIYVTEYGNLSSMLKLSNLAKEQEFVSARLFPNATIGSASVVTSLTIGARGLNTTIGAGFMGYYYGVEMAGFYFDSNKLDVCLILTGDICDNVIVEEELKRKNIKLGLQCVTGTLLVNDLYAEKNKLSGSTLTYQCKKRKNDDLEYIQVFDKYYFYGSECSENSVFESSFIALKCKEIFESNHKIQCIYFGEKQEYCNIMEIKND